MQPREACPARLEYDMDMARGVNQARLLAHLRARLEAGKLRLGRLQMSSTLRLPPRGRSRHKQRLVPRAK